MGERKFQTEGSVAHQPLVVSENYSDCPFVWYQNVRSTLIGFVTKHACDRRADGRTDGQNYDSQDRASIAASRGKNADRRTALRSANLEQLVVNVRRIIDEVLMLRWIVERTPH